MLKLSYNPTIGTTIPVYLNFKDSAGKLYVPAKINYTFLALNKDKNSWKIVDEIYEKSVQPSSQVAVVIPKDSNILVEGTLPRRQIRINWTAYLLNQITEFEEIVEFDVNPYPIISSEIPSVPNDTITLNNPKLVKVVETNEDGTINRFVKLITDFPVDTRKFEANTFLIDDVSATPSINSSCNELTFDVSNLSMGTHNIKVDKLYSQIVGVLSSEEGPVFEQEFTLFDIKVDSIVLSDPETQSISHSATTLSDALVEIVEKYDTLNSELIELKETVEQNQQSIQTITGVDIPEIQNRLTELEKSN